MIEIKYRSKYPIKSTQRATNVDYRKCFLPTETAGIDVFRSPKDLTPDRLETTKTKEALILLLFSENPDSPLNLLLRAGGNVGSDPARDGRYQGPLRCFCPG